MAYTDFTLERVEADFGLSTELITLFPDVVELPASDWVVESLARARRFAALVSEKSRSEYLVAPILAAAQDYASGDLGRVDKTQAL